MQSKSKYILITIAVIILGMSIWYLKTIFIYLIISIILSLIGQPFVKLFSRIRINKHYLSPTVCSVLTIFLLITISIGLFSLFIPLIVQEARIISKINPSEVVEAFKQPLKNLEYDLQKYQINADDTKNVQTSIISKLKTILSFEKISFYAQRMFGFLGSLIAAFLSISFITFFLLKDEHLIHDIILLLSPPKHLQAVTDILKNTKLILRRYFIGILFDMLFVATLTSVGLSILGIQNAMLIGLFAGVLNVIPYIGPILGCGFAILIGISSNLNLDFYSQLLPLIGKIALSFLIVQLIDALFFHPLVISNTVKAHPLEIFLVILTAGTIAGIIGIVVAIPVYTIIRIIAIEFLNNFQIIQKLTRDLEETIENKEK